MVKCRRQPGEEIEVNSRCGDKTGLVGLRVICTRRRCACGKADPVPGPMQPVNNECARAIECARSFRLSCSNVTANLRVIVQNGSAANIAL